MQMRICRCRPAVVPAAGVILIVHGLGVWWLLRVIVHRVWGIQLTAVQIIVIVVHVRWVHLVVFRIFVIRMENLHVRFVIVIVDIQQVGALQIHPVL